MTDVSATSESSLREAICRFGRSLFERGLTPGSSGNISLRLDDGGWLVTPTNASLAASSTQAGSPASTATGGSCRATPPTKEIPLHGPSTTAGFGPGDRASPFHPRVAVSMLPEIDPRAVLPPLTPYSLMRAGAVALVPYFRPGDPAVADAIRGLAGQYSSVLLANHGPVVAGDNLEAAVFATEELEETAKLYLLLRNLNPRHLTPRRCRTW